MEKYQLAIIGSGIGGSLIAALNQDKDHILFEKDKNLGGCASTFKRHGNYYNTGATTLVGYEKNHTLKKEFDKIGFVPNLLKSNIAIRVIQNRKTIDRTENFEDFLEQINRLYPHKNNQKFWLTIKTLDEKFWQLKNLYFSKYSLKAYYNDILSFIELYKTYKNTLFINAKSFINKTLPNISKEYQSFIDSQLLITVQSTSKEISLISMALGLSYPFHSVFYANGGMGNVIDGILNKVNVHTKEKINTIKKEKNYYRIISNKNEYLAKQVILNATIYDSAKLFDDSSINSYYNQFKFSDQSAFVIYLTIDSKENFLEHYQIILRNNIPNCFSPSFFISFSKKEDNKMSKNGYSVTISTHSKASYWNGLSTQTYKKNKKLTQDFIINEFLSNFDTINKADIVDCFSATSQTFKRYINRSNCGGKAISIKNILQTPTAATPFNGLFNVGDTIFAGQGWPGIALGVDILNKELNAKF